MYQFVSRNPTRVVVLVFTCTGLRKTARNTFSEFLLSWVVSRTLEKLMTVACSRQLNTKTCQINGVRIDRHRSQPRAKRQNFLQHIFTPFQVGSRWRAQLPLKIDLLRVGEESQKLRKQLHDGIIRIIQSHPVPSLNVEICNHSKVFDDGARGAHGIGNVLQHPLVKLGV